MTYKIGIFGSAEGAMVDAIIPKAHELGEVLSKEDVIIITGACNGLPYEVALIAHKYGKKVWGYTETADLEAFKKAIPHDPALYEKLIYVPKDYPFIDNHLVTRKYRNVTSTANSDAGIIISGRWGSLNEFTNLYDMGKIIGVLTGTGGIADELAYLDKKIHKPGKAKIIFNDNPDLLVKEILSELKKRT